LRETEKTVLNKAIESGQERRKHYRKAKAWDYSCRNHGALRVLPQ
jgi:hypothetical protein